MSDEMLAAIDDALSRRTMNSVADRQPAENSGRGWSGTSPEEQEHSDGEHLALESRDWRRPSLVEVYFALQFLWGALLFVPGAQGFRTIVRALPYVSGLALLAWHFTKPFSGRRPGGNRLLMAALFLLAVNLLHSTTQFGAGLAQCIFQLSIAAPLFWAHKAVRNTRALERLLLLVFIMNLMSAALGVLQVYRPDRFMPSQFSARALQLNDAYVDSLTYVGNDGRLIIRPPGLSDMPGGAALAGSLTALLGLGLLLRPRKLVYTAGLLGSTAIGFAVIYLTQIRSVLLMTIGAAALLGVIALRRGRIAGGGVVLGAGGALVVASFLWAASVGGESIQDRFLSIGTSGALQTYQTNRGQFLASTLGEQLDAYPFGAGVGRWGMMNAYFGDDNHGAAPLWVEIQLTGWLFDGGLLMWVFYGGAIVASILAALRISASREPRLAEAAIVILTVQVFIAGMSMAGPAFNTQLGILFWALAAILHGARIPAADDGGEPVR